MRKRYLAGAAAILVAAGTGALLAGGAGHDREATAKAPSTIARESAPVTLPSFKAIAKEESSGVVNISTTKVVRRASMEGLVPHGFQFFEMPDGQPSRRSQYGEGSGFVVDGSGLILTNRHVVDGADKVWVTLPGGKKYEAKVIGRDARTDIALLRIHPPESIKALPLGDSSQAEPGDWVMAVGNPFGLGGNSVSVGVVSFMGRPLDLSEKGSPVEMIQTDAAINPGNSGGPLLDSQGRVIGINTLIMTQGVPQSSGVGFAVPINAVKEILPQLRDKGHVTRGWLGVQVQSMNDDLASSLGLSGMKGALVASVDPESAAGKAGVKPEDLIVKLNGTDVESSAALAQKVTALAPGSSVELEVVRDGKHKTLTAHLGTFPESSDDTSGTTGKGEARLGLALTPLRPDIKREFDLPENLHGLLVRDVEPGSPSEIAGLRPGDVIVEAGRKEVQSVSELQGIIKGGGTIALRVYRDGGYTFIPVKPESKAG